MAMRRGRRCDRLILVAASTAKQAATAMVRQTFRIQMRNCLSTGLNVDTSVL
jgi:hypothetical protein